MHVCGCAWWKEGTPSSNETKSCPWEASHAHLAVCECNQQTAEAVGKTRGEGPMPNDIAKDERGRQQHDDEETTEHVRKQQTQNAQQTPLKPRLGFGAATAHKRKQQARTQVRTETHEENTHHPRVRGEVGWARRRERRGPARPAAVRQT